MRSMYPIPICDDSMIEYSMVCVLVFGESKGGNVSFIISSSSDTTVDYSPALAIDQNDRCGDKKAFELIAIGTVCFLVVCNGLMISCWPPSHHDDDNDANDVGTSGLNHTHSSANQKQTK